MVRRRSRLWRCVIAALVAVPAAGTLRWAYADDDAGVTPIYCPDAITANTPFNTFAVQEIGDSESFVLFTATAYSYQSGVRSSGNCWYKPSPRTTDLNGITWEWLDAGVYWECRHLELDIGLVTLLTLDYYIAGDHTGVAAAHYDIPQEELRGGVQTEGGEDCYEVWIWWVDETGYHEQDTNQEVCFFAE